MAMLTWAHETDERNEGDLSLRAGKPWDLLAAESGTLVFPAVGENDLAGLLTRGGVGRVGGGFLGVGHGGGGESAEGRPAVSSSVRMGRVRALLLEVKSEVGRCRVRR